MTRGTQSAARRRRSSPRPGDRRSPAQGASAPGESGAAAGGRGRVAGSAGARGAAGGAPWTTGGGTKPPAFMARPAPRRTVTATVTARRSSRDAAARRRKAVPSARVGPSSLVPNPPRLSHGNTSRRGSIAEFPTRETPVGAARACRASTRRRGGCGGSHARGRLPAGTRPIASRSASVLCRCRQNGGFPGMERRVASTGENETRARGVLHRLSRSSPR